MNTFAGFSFYMGTTSAVSLICRACQREIEDGEAFTGKPYWYFHATCFVRWINGQ